MTVTEIHRQVLEFREGEIKFQWENLRLVSIPSSHWLNSSPLFCLTLRFAFLPHWPKECAFEKLNT